jgi:hypothetical protein
MKIAITKEINPEFIASLPSVGPMIVSDIMFAGASNLPDFRMLAR